MILETGKIDSDLLKKIVFEKITYRRPEVMVRPGIGEDCAVVDYGDSTCVISTDPITAAVSDIGRLAIHITCNDIASNGVQPVGIMIAAMLPVGTTDEDVAMIMEQAGETAAQLQVEIIGGHTEITSAVNKPVIVSTAIGRGPKNDMNSADNMKPGDVILITKRVGIEGAGIIASDLAHELEGHLTEEEFAEARGFLDEVSVVKEGVAAGAVGTHGMHDVTEGGVLGAVYEMAQIAGSGAEIMKNAIPVNRVTEKIAAVYGINPLRLISSGCMLIVAAPDKKDEIVNAVEAEGIDIHQIGRITEKEEGLVLVTDEGREEILPPGADELYRAVK